MANLNQPYGLSPQFLRNGSPYNGMGRMYMIAATDTNAFYVGDVVSMANTSDTTDQWCVPIVTLTTAGAGNPIRGVIAAVGGPAPQGGFQPGGPYINPTNLQSNYRPAASQTSAWMVLVHDDPNIVFSIQENLNGGTFGPQSSIASKNASFVYAAPATGVFVSGTMLDANTYAAGATYQLKLLGPVMDGVNTPLASYQRLLVTINNHDFNAGTTGI